LALPKKEPLMRRERFDKMNVVPFIDIVLVLLVIVLATATFVTNQTIKVDLPSASSEKNEERKSIHIAINKEGEYFYDKEALSLDLIKEKLMKLDPKKDLVSLHMDKESAFQYFVSIIDILKTKGFENISIITKK
jgi:biopolymer transport protein ExbD